MSFRYFESYPPWRLLIAAAGAAALLLVSACAASSPVPPQRDPYFPASLAVAPDERYLFVANANSDLKFGSGSVQVYDLEAVTQLAAAWQGGAAAEAPAGCTKDASHPELAHCPSTTANGQRAGYVLASAAQIGNFASTLRVQQLTGGSLRLFSSVRGDPSITWLDFDPATGKLDCGSSGSFPRCDDRHRIDTYRDAPLRNGITTEPFGLSVDSEREHVVVTHLTSGDVSLVRAPKDPTQLPTLEDSLSGDGLWTPIRTSGAQSAVSVATRPPGNDAESLFYVTSRVEARVSIVHAVDSLSADGQKTSRLVRAGSFFWAPAPAGGGSSGDARGIGFSTDGNLAYMATRAPSSLMIFDTSLDPQGVPQHELLTQVGLCPHLTVNQGGGPDALAVHELASGPRVYVTCFDIGEVWVVDADHGLLEATVTVGLGPDSLAIAPGRKQVFVGNYGDDTISVIDVDPTSPTYQHTVLQLGKLRGED